MRFSRGERYITRRVFRVCNVMCKLQLLEKFGFGYVHLYAFFSFILRAHCILRILSTLTEGGSNFCFATPKTKMMSHILSAVIGLGYFPLSCGIPRRHPCCLKLRERRYSGGVRPFQDLDLWLAVSQIRLWPLCSA